MSVKIGSTQSFLGSIQKPQGDPVNQETVRNCRHENSLTQIIKLLQIDSRRVIKDGWLCIFVVKQEQKNNTDCTQGVSDHNTKKHTVKKKTPKLVTMGIQIITLLKLRVYLRTYLNKHT